jgi:putative oxidoreductase
VKPWLLFLALTAVAFAAGRLLLGPLARRASPGRLSRALLGVACLVPAAVFLAAAYGKLRDPYAFAVSIFAYRLVTPGIATVAAVAMPAIEVLAAVALATGILRRGGAIVISAMLVVFIAALFQAIVRGIDIECGCFGKGSSPVSFWLIARNYGLLLLALFPLAAERARRVRST